MIVGFAVIVLFEVGVRQVAVVFLVWFVILCIWAYFVRNRIPFAEAVLTAASHVTPPTHPEQAARCSALPSGLLTY